MKTSIKVGDIFKSNSTGDVVVVEYINFSNVLVECIDDHKHRMRVFSQNLRDGSFRNPFYKAVYGVGFVGFGNHSASFNNVNTKPYMAWRNIMERCYSQLYHQTRPCYKGCYVDNRWHNFQVFAEWLAQQKGFGNERWAIDKDILINGNKVYGPDACCVIPPEINGLFIRPSKRKSSLPLGVSKRSNYYIAQMHGLGDGVVYIGRFNTAEEADCAYRTAKSQRILFMANKWKPFIDNKVFEALTGRAEHLLAKSTLPDSDIHIIGIS